MSVRPSARRVRHVCPSRETYLSVCVQVSDADMQSVTPQDATSATAADEAE